MISKYKTMHILLANVHLDCRGKGSSLFMPALVYRRTIMAEHRENVL